MLLKKTFVLRSAARVVFLLATPAIFAAPVRSPLLHKSAPDFVRDDIHGNSMHLASLRGKVVLLTFWATWCAPCQIEMPHFVRWQQELGSKGLQIVAISMDDSAEPVRALTQRRNVEYPVIMGDEQLGKIYGGVLGLPVTFLIDRHGNIAAVFKGASTLTDMKAQILTLLGTQ